MHGEPMCGEKGVKGVWIEEERERGASTTAPHHTITAVHDMIIGSEHSSGPAAERHSSSDKITTDNMFQKESK